MLLETFRQQEAKAVYRRLRDKGRALPEGVVFSSSDGMPTAATASSACKLVRFGRAALGRGMVGPRALGDRAGAGGQRDRRGARWRAL